MQKGKRETFVLRPRRIDADEYYSKKTGRGFPSFTTDIRKDICYASQILNVCSNGFNGNFAAM